MRFLQAVTPQVAVISVGTGNRFGHPAPEVLERLEEAGVQVWRTDECGDVEIVTDGERLWVRTGRAPSMPPVRALPARGVIRETLEGMCFRFVCGMPGEPQLPPRMLPYLRAVATARRLAQSRIGLHSYASMGMYTGTIDHTQLRTQVRPEIDQLDGDPDAFARRVFSQHYAIACGDARAELQALCALLGIRLVE